MQELEAKQRTNQQNRALHLWLTQVSKTLNDAGLDMKATLKEDVEIPWTMEMAKEYLWRPIMKITTGEGSTTDMNTIDPTVITETITRHMGQKHGVVLPPWPDRFGQYYDNVENN